jgi:hypothetical protein
MMTLCLLPVELLVQIMSCLRSCTSIIIRHSDNPTSDAICPAWMRITHVCRHLRDIALGAPQLWTQADVHWSSKLVSLYLQRSLDAPLVVWCELGRRTDYPVMMSSASLLLPRTRSLYLSMDYPARYRPNVRGEIARLVSEATPRLLHLSLRSTSSMEWTPDYLGGSYEDLVHLELGCYELGETPNFPFL